MSRTFKTSIMRDIGVPNKNGRIYSKETVETAIAKAKSEIFGTLGMNASATGAVNLDQVAFSVTDMRVDGDTVIGTVKVLNTLQGELLERLLTGDQVGFVSCGVGQIDKDGTVSDYSMSYVAAVPKDRV